MSTSAHAVAAWSAGLRWRGIPDAQRALVRLRVLDTSGLILAGSQSEAAPALLAVAGTQARSAATAALVHGTLAHCRDFDDTFADSIVHPGSTVISTALAVGNTVGASSEEIATAIVIGYEAAARIGAAAGRRFHARGFHATGVVGPLAAALVAARLYGLGPKETVSAIGLAASMSGGLMAFADDGTWSKWLHVGWSAHGGVLAAQLAASGFRGPAGALDGRYNLFSAFLGEPAPDSNALWGDLGERWAGSAAHFKYYPCAHVIQPYIDAAIHLREVNAVDLSRIERVTCRIAPWAIPIVCTPRAAKLRPLSEMDAIASLPYQLAVALADGRVGLDSLGAASRGRREILGLAERVEHVADESLGRGFDGRIEVVLQSGERLEIAVAPAPADRPKLLAKFRANARLALTESSADALERALTAEPLPRFGELTLILSKIEVPKSV